jgi:hypothetical protein
MGLQVQSRLSLAGNTQRARHERGQALAQKNTERARRRRRTSVDAAAAQQALLGWGG